MKKLVNFFTKNWIPKAISLLVAVVTWYLINSQVKESKRMYHKTFQGDTWTE